MKNAFQDGRVLDVTLTAAVASGGVVTHGRMLGVAVMNGAIGDTIGVHVEGVFRLPKLSTAVIAAYEPVTWDIAPTPRVIVASATTGDVENFGYAIEAAGNGATTVLVRLCPGAGVPKPA
jgi:predicted RecA/RadA family phage recombinase